jgi:hypothetical protein
LIEELEESIPVFRSVRAPKLGKVVFVLSAGCLRRRVELVGDHGYSTLDLGLHAEIEKDDVPEHLIIAACELGATAVKADSWRQRLSKRLRGECVIGLPGSELMPIHEHGLAPKNRTHEASHEKPG